MGAVYRIRQNAARRAAQFCDWLGPTRCVLVGAGILFFSFLVQLLTSIGVPFIHFDFYRFDLQNYAFIELGMWAACNGQEALIIPSMPSASQPERYNCPPAAWGWKSLRYSGITNAFFDKNLPKALIMHPISCGFTFMAMCTALITMKRQRQHFLLPIFSFFSCLFAFCSFIIDVATFVPARAKLMSPKAFEVLGTTVTSTTLGPAFWLSLSCFVLDIVGNGIIISGYGIWRHQRTMGHRRMGSAGYGQNAGYDDVELKAGSRMHRRRYFDNDSTLSLGNRSPFDDENENEKTVSAHGGMRTFGTSSALSKLKSFSVRSKPPTHLVHMNVLTRDQRDTPTPETPSTAHDTMENVIEDRDHYHGHQHDDIEEAEMALSGDEDGYDSGVDAFVDARSQAGASRSRVNLANASHASLSQAHGQEVAAEEVASPVKVARNVKRKPVSGHY